MPRRLLFIGNFLSHAGFSPSTCEVLADKLRERGCHVFTTSSRVVRVSRFLDMLFSTLRWRAEYDVAYVEVYSGLAFIWAEWVSKLLVFLNKPVVLSLHGGRLPEFAIEHPERVKKLLRSAQKVIAPSEFLRQGLKEYCSDIEVIPNGIDVSCYSYSSRAVLRANLIWLRAFHQIYNPKMAISVIAELSDKFPEISLEMIGPDKDGSAAFVKTLAEQSGVAKNLRMIGSVEKKDVPKYLNRNDIFLNTTYIDNTPVSVVEAMSCGLCIVTTNVGGIPYLLEHSKTALLVDSDDVDAMSAAVTRLLTEPSLAGELSRNARIRAQQFDWDIVLPQWLEVFDCVRGAKI